MTRPLPAERRRRSLTARQREKFLEALSSGWSVTHAAKLAGKARQRFYETRDDDEGFASEWADAIEAGTDVLEDEARRRAVEGWDEEVFQRGELVGHVRRYDSGLLVALLKAHRPERFREGAQVEVNAPAVFVLESAFGRSHDVEASAVEVPELEEGER